MERSCRTARLTRSNGRTETPVQLWSNSWQLQPAVKLYLQGSGSMWAWLDGGDGVALQALELWSARAHTLLHTPLHNCVRPSQQHIEMDVHIQTCPLYTKGSGNIHVLNSTHTFFLFMVVFCTFYICWCFELFIACFLYLDHWISVFHVPFWLERHLLNKMYYEMVRYLLVSRLKLHVTMPNMSSVNFSDGREVKTCGCGTAGDVMSIQGWVWANWFERSRFAVWTLFLSFQQFVNFLYSSWSQLSYNWTIIRCMVMVEGVL